VAPLQIITEVEVYPEANFTKEIVGGTIGGLLLLAIITAGLYKVTSNVSMVNRIDQMDCWLGWPTPTHPPCLAS